jgi:hypothetical protein
MIIEKTTKLNFNPRSKQEVEGSGHHVAFYDVVVDDELLGLTEIVVSKGRDVTTILEADDGTRFERDQLAEALIHAGHKVEL